MKRKDTNTAEKLVRRLEQGLEESRDEFKKLHDIPVSARKDIDKLFQETELTCRQLKENNRIPTFLVVGKTGSGKSSLINALLEKHLAEVGTGPQTGGAWVFEDEQKMGEKEPSCSLGRFIDTPGWGEGDCPRELQTKMETRSEDYESEIESETESESEIGADMEIDEGETESVIVQPRVLHPIMSLKKAIKLNRPDAIIYCVTPATLYSQDITADLSRLSETKRLVESITGLTASLCVVLTKADSDLGPHILKDSEEHQRVTECRITTIKESLQCFRDQSLCPNLVSICSSVARYKIRYGATPDFSACDVSKVRESLLPGSNMMKSIQRARFTALEDLRLSVGNYLVWYYSVLNLFMSYLPFLDILICYANTKKMLKLISLSSPEFPASTRISDYTIDFSVILLFVTALRMVGLVALVYILQQGEGALSPSFFRIVFFLFFMSALLIGLKTLNVGYSALNDFSTPKSLTSQVIAALKKRKPLPATIDQPYPPTVIAASPQPQPQYQPVRIL